MSKAFAIAALNDAVQRLDTEINTLQTARDNAADDIIRWDIELIDLNKKRADAIAGQATVNSQIP